MSPCSTRCCIFPMGRAWPWRPAIAASCSRTRRASARPAPRSPGDQPADQAGAQRRRTTDRGGLDRWRRDHGPRCGQRRPPGQLRRFPLRTQPRRAMARSPGSSDIVLRPIASDEPRFVLGRHGGASALAFSPDGTLLAVAFRDHTTVLWDVAKREQFGVLRGHREAGCRRGVQPGRRVDRHRESTTTPPGSGRHGPGRAWPRFPATAQHYGCSGLPRAIISRRARIMAATLFLYRITGRHGVQQWLTGHRSEVRSVAAHPLRERIATSGGAELISWDLPASRPSPAVMEPNPGAVTGLAYSPDGSLLATASWRWQSDYREVSHPGREHRSRSGTGSPA